MFTSGAFGYLADYLLAWLIFFSLLIHTWCFFKLFPKNPRRRAARLVLGNTLVFFCLIGLGALGAETWLRFFSIQIDLFGVTRPAQRWFACYVHFNEEGYRDRPWDEHGAHAQGDGWDIAFIGDSFAYGWGIERVEDRMSNLLEKALTERMRRPVRVYNVAKPGWNTGQEAAALEELLARRHFDEIILCHVPNDIEDLVPRPVDVNLLRPPESRFFNTDSSFLAEYVYYRVLLPFSPNVSGYHDWLAAGYANPAVWNAQTGRFQAIMDAAVGHGTRLRVLLFPFLRVGGQQWDSEKNAQQVGRFWREREIPVLDLAPLFSARKAGELVVNAADSHPNAEAHKIAAEAMLKAWYSE